MLHIHFIILNISIYELKFLTFLETECRNSYIETDKESQIYANVPQACRKSHSR